MSSMTSRFNIKRRQSKSNKASENETNTSKAISGVGGTFSKQNQAQQKKQQT